jgi:flavin reductase (DIM6/NTAB) family NADH-FMN oxidoreductase RutF
MSTDWLTSEVAAAVPASTIADAPSIDATDFKSIFRRHPAGVAIITLTDVDRLVGFTATSVISVSADPPIVAFSVSATSSAWPALARNETVAISFLTAAQADVSARFATSGIDRFAAGGWTRLPSGEPVIAEASSWLRGAILERTSVGTSFLIAVRAIDCETVGTTPPLVFHDRAYHRVDDASAL